MRKYNEQIDNHNISLTKDLVEKALIFNWFIKNIVLYKIKCYICYLFVVKVCYNKLKSNKYIEFIISN